jgi:hypothetical protein
LSGEDFFFSPFDWHFFRWCFLLVYEPRICRHFVRHTNGTSYIEHCYAQKTQTSSPEREWTGDLPKW